MENMDQYELYIYIYMRVCVCPYVNPKADPQRAILPQPDFGLSVSVVIFSSPILARPICTRRDHWGK